MNNSEYTKEQEVRDISALADQIQAYALNIYGKYDLDKSMLWMTEEFGEVISAIRKNKSKDDICGEIGDLTAWILCLCNILEIDFSEAIASTFNKELKRQLNKYGKFKYWKDEQ